MNKLNAMLILMMCTLILAACWDQIEIEERAFIFGMAIDAADKTEVKLTQQLVVPENMATVAANAGGGGKAYRNLSSTGKTIYEINLDLAKQASRSIDSTHLGVILFSEDIMKQPGRFKEHFDVFFREKRMRRGIKLAITNGLAEDLLYVEAEHEKIPAEYIKNLLENKKRLDVTDLVRIGDIDEKLYEETSFPLPYLKKISSTVIDYEGIAIYNGKEERMVGVLKGDDAKALSYIRGLKNNGSINTEIDGGPMTIEILTIKRKITLTNNDPNNLQFSIKIQIKGAIADQSGWENLKEYEVLNKFYKKTSEKIEEMVKNTINKLQNDFQTDAMGLGEYLNRYYPKIWKEVQDEWDNGKNYFSKSDIDCEVKIVIEEPGSINKTTSK